jgi:hypothetical protein
MKVNRSIEVESKEEVVMEEELVKDEEVVVEEELVEDEKVVVEEELLDDEEVGMEDEEVVMEEMEMEEEEEEQQEDARSLLLARTSTPAPNDLRSRLLRRIPEKDNDTSPLPDFGNDSFVIDNTPIKRIINSTMLDQTSLRLDTTCDTPNKICFSPVPVREFSQSHYNTRDNRDFDFNDSRVSAINSIHNQPNMNQSSQMMDQDPLRLYLSSQNSSQMDDSRSINNPNFNNFESSRMSFNNSQSQIGFNPSMPGSSRTSDYNFEFRTPRPVFNQSGMSMPDVASNQHFNGSRFADLNGSRFYDQYLDTSYFNQTTEDLWLKVRNQTSK